MSSPGKVHKVVLSNGLTLLVHPTSSIPMVNMQLWYNVGSKDEKDGQRGMAHLMEHMLFKGTEKLSESDINLITHKLAGYSNAFTSFDYTSYVFEMPSNSWRECIGILADCMVNSNFHEEMLASELLAVIQEMKMYRDDYQLSLIESMISTIYPEHPYHHPIIGYKQDLCSLTRDNLYAFYQEHYHPGNATLVVVGDVDVDEVVSQTKKDFEAIPAKQGYKKEQFFVNEDITSKAVTLYRDVSNPWVCYAYVIPGYTSKQSYAYDLIASLLGEGKSSRLHDVLVHQEHLASSVECFSYYLFDTSLFFICVQPNDTSSLVGIEELVNSEVRSLAEHGMHEWEFEKIQKQMKLHLADTLQSYDKIASFIGNAYLAFGDENYLSTYYNLATQVSPEELQSIMHDKMKRTVQHKGLLLPLHESDRKHLVQIQEDSDKLDAQVLSQFTRTLPVEAGKMVHEIESKEPKDFTYPKPERIMLSNGIEVLYHHNERVEQLSMILSLKVDHLYDPPEFAGIAYFYSNLLVQGTEQRSALELNKFLEINGIELETSAGILSFQMLPESFDIALEVMHELLTQPLLSDDNVEHVRKKLLLELNEYWDSPIEFVEQLAREVVYQEHPYAKNVFGTIESVQRIGKEHLKAYADTAITPDQATLIIVGDLGAYPPEKLTALLEEKLGSFKGPQVPALVGSVPEGLAAQEVKHLIQRDQVVVGFAAPSVARTNSEYDILSLIDVVLTGGPVASMSSRLFQLREQSGLFYTIGGSLVYGARTEPGMLFIRTIVSTDKVTQAEKAIRQELVSLGQNGITQDEFEMARNVLIASTVGHFENNFKTAQTFLLLKRCALGFDLFDKRGSELSILNVNKVNEVCQKYYSDKILSLIKIGRIE